MANKFSTQETILFEKVIEGFNNTNLFAKNVEQFQPSAEVFERAGQVVRFPVDYQSESSTGIDVSSDYKDQTQSTIQVDIADADVKNAAFKMTARDRNSPERLSQIADSAVRKLSSDLDTQVKSTIVARGALIGAETTAISTYDQLGKADALMAEVEAPMGGQRSMYVPPRIATSVGADLANRETLSGVPLSAYARATLSPVAGFDTFKTNVTSTVGVTGVVTVVINGANQDSDLVAWKSDTTVSAPTIDDWRFQVLTVTNTSGSLTNGDVFTIAGVNRVGQDTKEDTGQLMTFRVISGGGTTTPTISPAIIVSGPYQTVSAIPANGAAVVGINTDASNPVVFAMKSAIVLLKSTLDVSGLGDNVTVDTATTDSGLSIIFARQGEIDDLSARYRFTFVNRAHVVDPLKCGLLLENQNVAI